MKFPNAHRATVPEQKITRYLLNPAHPVGGSKASFFVRYGFTVADWRRLADALLRHARENEVVETEKTRRASKADAAQFLAFDPNPTCPVCVVRMACAPTVRQAFA